MKKGMAVSNAMVVVAVAVISLIIISIVFINIFSASKDTFTDAQCRASLELSSSINDKVVGGRYCVLGTVAFPLQCTRKFFTVLNDGGKPDVKDKNFDSVKNKYEVSCPATGKYDSTNGCLPENVFAQQMTSCWDLFFRGEVPVLHQAEVNNLPGWVPYFNGGDTRACYVCAEIAYEGGRNFNLSEYIRHAMYNNEETFYQHLTNPSAFCDDGLLNAFAAKYPNKPKNCWEALAAASDTKKWSSIDIGNIQSGKSYSVIFMRRGMSSCDSDTDKTGDSLISMAVQVVPSDNINKYCSVVVA